MRRPLSANTLDNNFWFRFCGKFTEEVAQVIVDDSFFEALINLIDTLGMLHIVHHARAIIPSIVQYFLI